VSPVRLKLAKRPILPPRIERRHVFRSNARISSSHAARERVHAVRPVEGDGQDAILTEDDAIHRRAKLARVTRPRIVRTAEWVSEVTRA
jgi:hypothetical protein